MEATMRQKGIAEMARALVRVKVAERCTSIQNGMVITDVRLAPHWLVPDHDTSPLQRWAGGDRFSGYGWVAALAVGGRWLHDVPYSQGNAHTKPPTMCDVLAALMDDAMSADVDFPTWCGDLGMDARLISSRETYEACRKTRDDLGTLLGPEAFAAVARVGNAVDWAVAAFSGMPTYRLGSVYITGAA